MKKYVVAVTILISMIVSANAQIKVVSPTYKGLIILSEYLAKGSGCYLSLNPNDSTYVIHRSSVNKFDPQYCFRLGKLDEAKKTIQSLLDLLNNMNDNEMCVVTFPTDFNHVEFYFTKVSATYRGKTYSGFLIRATNGYAGHTYLNPDELELYLNTLSSVENKMIY